MGESIKAAVSPSRPAGAKPKRRKISGKVRENAELYLIMLPVLIHIFIFSYLPLYGIVIAFQDYLPGSGFITFDGNTQWVGLKHFHDFVSNMYFWRLIKNTLVLSVLNLGLVFWIPILFALVLNEVKAPAYKKTVQTISYLPHFISAVVVAGMVLSFTNTDGVINQARMLFGLPVIAYNNSPEAFPWIYTLTNIWRTFGFGSILYLSSMSSIDPSLYEAARLDGANRWKQIRHITFPMIMPTVTIMLIFAVGGLLNANSELILLLYNPAIYQSADVVGTYVYRDALLTGRFSYGTAVDIFTAIINFMLVFGANFIARKTTEYSLW